MLFLDDDDELFPYTISSLMSILCRTGADMVTTSPVFFSSASPRDQPLSSMEYWLVPGGPLLAGLFVNTFSGPCFLVTKSAFARVHNKYDPGAGPGFSLSRAGNEDWEFHVRAHIAGLRIEKTVEPHYYYRTGNSKSMSKTLNPYEGAIHATRGFEALFGAASADLLVLQRLAFGMHTAQH